MSRDPFLNQSQDHGGTAMPSLKPGQWMFDRRYELIRQLGAGGMGVVWLARDHREDSDVALKFLPTVLVLQEGEMKRLKDEVRAGKELRHPRLVATYGLEVEDATAAIVMEYVPGQTLKELLEAQQRGFFEPEEIAGWIWDVCDALTYLHGEARRIHRDIKPANILVDAAGRARLMDFGISHRIQESVTRQSRSVVPPLGGSEPPKGGTTNTSSTLAYASPQQLAGRATNAADDLYSLGATMYELLTGTPPFYRGGIEVVGFQIATQPVVPILERRQELVEEGANASAGQSVPAAVETTIQACLAKEREKRPANAKTVCEALAAGRAAGPPAAANVPIPARTTPAALGGPSALPQARSPLWRALGALLILAAAGWGWKALFPPDNRYDKLPSSPEDLKKAAMEQVLKEQAEKEKKAKAEAGRAAGPPGAASKENPKDHTGPQDDLIAEDLIKISTITIPKKQWKESDIQLKSVGKVYTPPVLTEASKRGDFIEKQRSQAREAWLKIKIGSDFGSVAKAYSEDSRAEMNGSWDWLDRSDLNPEIAEAAFALNRGEISNVIELDSGFMIIRCDDKKSKVSTVLTATKESPFTNSLGMKFVPVPINAGPSKDQRILFSIWETRSKDYAAFVKDSGHDAGEDWKTYTVEDVPVGRGEGEKAEESSHPVANVSHDDGVAFCAWLTKKDRASGLIGPQDEYRLPSDVEWSYAVGIGDQESASVSPQDKDAKIDGVYPWGGSLPPPAGSGNYADTTAKAKGTDILGIIEGYTDGYATTAPVGSFKANALGLHDMGGNLWEWASSPYGSVGTTRVLRGSSWCSDGASGTLSSDRNRDVAGIRGYDIGFRCVLVVGGG